MKKPTSENSFHHVYIADDNGMPEIFPIIRSRVSEKADQHISLIYYSENNRYTFRRELEVLRQHHPAQFLIFYENLIPDRAPDMIQETIEVILNANTMSCMDFTLAGDLELLEEMKDKLLFLGIEKKEIHLISPDNYFQIN